MTTTETAVLTQPDAGAAIAAGVQQALVAAAPAIVALVAASDPRVAAVLTVAQTLAPSVATLIEQFSNQSMTQEEFTAKLAALHVDVETVHKEWLASVNRTSAPA